MKFQQATKLQHPGLWQSNCVIDPEFKSPVDGPSISKAVNACVDCSSEQWITVVGGNREFIAQLLASGVPSSRIRWLRTGNSTEREWALEQATLAGTSAVIIGWLSKVDARFCQRVKMASRLSQSQHFLFEEDTLLSHLH